MPERDHTDSSIYTICALLMIKRTGKLREMTD